MDNEALLKIDVELDPTEWHGHACELLWAEPRTAPGDVGKVLKLVNTPYFAKKLSWGDIVQVQLSCDDNRYKIGRVLERSGHSTYRVLVDPENSKFDSYLAHLKKLGCRYERATLELPEGSRVLYAIDIPPDADVYAAYSIFEQGEKDSTFVFEEGHVGHRLRGA